jgi:hypothetical protein
MGLRNHFIYSAYLDTSHPDYKRILLPVIRQMILPCGNIRAEGGWYAPPKIEFDYIYNRVVINHFDGIEGVIFVNNMFSNILGDIQKFINFIDPYVFAPFLLSSEFLGFFTGHSEGEENSIIHPVKKGTYYNVKNI